MIQLTDLITIFGDSFLGGNTLLAGLIVLAVVMAVVMAMTKSAFAMLLIAIPTTLTLSYMRAIPDEVTIIMLLVAVVGLALSSKRVFN